MFLDTTEVNHSPQAAEDYQKNCQFQLTRFSATAVTTSEFAFLVQILRFTKYQTSHMLQMREMQLS